MHEDAIGMEKQKDRIAAEFPLRFRCNYDDIIGILFLAVIEQ